MSVSSHFDPAKATLTIKVSGRFDFGVHQDFRNTLEQINPAVKTLVLDFFATEYMDSSALGMLLVLRDKINASTQTVKLINIKPQVKKILEIANFDKLFNIS